MGDDPARLTVGLLLGGERLRRWQAEAVQSLLAVPGVAVPVAFTDARGASASRGRGRPWSTLVWDIYNNRWVARRSRALKSERLRSVLPDCAIVPCSVETRGKWSEHFAEEDLEIIRSYDLDVLIRFGFGIIRGGILDAARYGVWSYHHDDDDVVRGGPPAFWEIIDDVPVTGTVLQRLTDRLDGGFVLHKGWFRTASASYVRNTDTVHLGAVTWPAALCRQLLAGDAEAAMGVKSGSDAPIRHKPTNAQAAGFLAGQARRWTSAQLRALITADEWAVGVVRAPIHRFLDEVYHPEIEWLDLAPSRQEYAADPFLAHVEGSDLLLYEHFDQRRRVGEIRSYELATRRPAPVELPVYGHASYPYLFESGDRTYLVPQVAGEPARLYEMRARAWVELGTVGPPEPVLDATVFQHEGRWWMMATRPGEWSLSHLYAWWADDLTGPWHPHLLNPVKTDVRSARPGGTPFVHDGQLFRPAQDGSREYGGALSITAVTDLDPEHFAEQVVRTVEPRPGWPYDRGIHTLSAAGDWTLLDAKRSRVSISEGRVELGARLAKVRRGR